MINNAEGKLESLQSVPLLYKRLFKKDYDFFDVLELSPLLMRKLGGLEQRTFLMKAEVQSYCLDLPCHNVKIQAVTDGKPLDFYGLSWEQNIAEQLIINYNLPDKHSEFSRPNDFEQPKAPTFIAVAGEKVVSRAVGNYVDFEHRDGKLFFNFENGMVDVIYRDIAKDSEGYPLIPEKAVEAFAYYLNYLEVQADFNNGMANGQQVQFAYQQKERAIAQARTPSAVSDNEMDALLNTLLSSARKKPNTPHRP